MNTSNIDQMIVQFSHELEKLISGCYRTILIVGGAARSEMSWDPRGKLLSDVDVLVIFPQKNLLLYILKND